MKITCGSSAPRSRARALAYLSLPCGAMGKRGSPHRLLPSSVQSRSRVVGPRGEFHCRRQTSSPLSLLCFWVVICCCSTVSLSGTPRAPHPTYSSPPEAEKRAKRVENRVENVCFGEGASREETRDYIEKTVLDDLRRAVQEHEEGVQRGERAARPFVTLAYAQSLDGSIARKDRSPVPLSGPESSMMTHGLRAIHDAILVGAGTIRQDNPRLNVRHWPPSKKQGVSPEHTNCTSAGPDGDTHVLGKHDFSPQAVILTRKLSDLPQNMRLSKAVVFTTDTLFNETRCLEAVTKEKQLKGALRDHTVVVCKEGLDGHCDLEDCLGKLYSMGFKSLMVEGGASVISSFVFGRWGSGLGNCEPRLVDRIVVTVVPMLFNGYNVLTKDGVDNGCPLSLSGVVYARLGNDVVVIGKPS